MTKRRVIAATLLLSAVVQVAVSVSAAADSRSRKGVTLYAASDFRGEEETFYEDAPRLNRRAIGNDRTSSVRVPYGCQVTLFADSDYRGRSTVLTQDWSNLTGTRIGNDSASSLQVDCREAAGGDGPDWDGRHGVVLYEHADFRGRIHWGLVAVVCGIRMAIGQHRNDCHC